jgi:hypothetical protein
MSSVATIPRLKKVVKQQTQHGSTSTRLGRESLQITSNTSNTSRELPTVGLVIEELRAKFLFECEDCESLTSHHTRSAISD